MRLDAAIADQSTRLAPLSETARLEAEVLLAHIFQKPRTWVLAHPEVELTAAQQNELEQNTARRQKGEPLPYILGHWEFYGLDFLVSPAVLIPRPETELLVERALEWLRNHPGCCKLADIGTGSGCIAIVLAANLPGAQVSASDISLQALEVAQRNAAIHRVTQRINFVQADLLNMPEDHCAMPFDLIAANLPYIPRHTLLNLPVYHTEPSLALNGGEDGLDLIRRLLEQAPRCLSPQGCLLLEIEAGQGADARALAQTTFPQAQIIVLPDLAGHDRLVVVDLSISRHPQLLVHLCSRPAWQSAQSQGSYQADSLKNVGFIHLSRPEQIIKVANAFYQGLPDPILLWIDPTQLQSELRWETVDHEIFPHLYGPLNLNAVVSVSELHSDETGVYKTIRI